MSVAVTGIDRNKCTEILSNSIVGNKSTILKNAKRNC